MIKLKDIVMIHDLRRQGLSIAAIARGTGLDPKTVRRHLERGLEAPAYGPRAPRPRLPDPFEGYLSGKVRTFPGLSGRRLFRGIAALGYEGGYTAVTDCLREARPFPPTVFERRSGTPPGRQAQVGFAEFRTAFADAPGVARKVWLFALVPGHSRFLWGRFRSGQDQGTVLRCHVLAFEAIGGAPQEILYDRMKTAALGEDAGGVTVYSPHLVDLLSHCGSAPRACRACRAKTKGKAGRPFRHIRRDFFPGRSFADADGLSRQFGAWRREAANPRVHAAAGRAVDEAFAGERASLAPLPAIPCSAVLTVGRRITRDGMVPVGGNLYSVPDGARRRAADVQVPADRIRIFESGVLTASHPVPEGRSRRRVDPARRKVPPASPPRLAAQTAVAERPLDLYGAAGRRLSAAGGAR